MTQIAVQLPNPERLAWWVDHLGGLLPEHEVRAAAHIRSPEEVGYAVVWKPPRGMLARWPNLKATISVGAGIDHIAADDRYPAHVPVVKTIGPDMTQRMREYVALHVLRLHRRMPELRAAQAAGEWSQMLTPTAQDRPVGILGMGHLGRAAATTLAALGFDVAGWSRSGDAPDGVTGMAEGDLDAFLGRSEILVCLLPLTPATDGLLNTRTFDALPRGAGLVNAARGAHLVEADLLAALQDGRIGHAVLDVFRTEPLPSGHAFWAHPQVTVTPHLASLIDPVSGGDVIARNIRHLDATGTAPDLTHIERGY